MNPFIYTKEATGVYFCSRDKYINTIKDDIYNMNNILLYSKRRFGKTSLIKKIVSEHLDNNIISIYVDLYSIKSKKELALTIAKSISFQLKSDPLNIIKEIANIFKYFKFSLEALSGVFSISVEPTSYDEDLLLSDVLNSFNLYLKKNNKKAFMVFDEFQEIDQFQENYEVEAQLRSMIQTHQNITYLFMGSKEHILSKMFQDHQRPFYSQAKIIELNEIEKDKYMVWANQFFKSQQSFLTTASIDTLYDISKGETKINNMILNDIYDKNNINGEITSTNILTSLQNSIENASDMFRNIFSMYSASHQKTLLVIANNQQLSIYNEKLLDKYSIKKSAFQSALKSLQTKEVIDKTQKGNFEIKNRLFELWLRQDRI